MIYQNQGSNHAVVPVRDSLPLSECIRRDLITPGSITAVARVTSESHNSHPGTIDPETGHDNSPRRLALGNVDLNPVPGSWHGLRMAMAMTSRRVKCGDISRYSPQFSYISAPGQMKGGQLP